MRVKKEDLSMGVRLRSGDEEGMKERRGCLRVEWDFYRPSEAVVALMPLTAMRELVWRWEQSLGLVLADAAECFTLGGGFFAY